MYCENCGSFIQDGEAFCSNCGSAVKAAPVGEPAPAPGPESVQPAPIEPIVAQPYTQAPYQQTAPQQPYRQAYQKPYQQAPAEGDPQDIASNKGMAAISYIGALVLIPLFFRSESPYARFHINQGLCLLFAEMAFNILNRLVKAVMPGTALSHLVAFVCLLAGIVFFVFSLMGLIRAARGEYKGLPIFGNIKILK